MNILLEELEELVETGAKEQELQSVLKKDLSLFAKAYAKPEDEYICFSELPVGNTGDCDFAVFTSRSFMKIYLIEVKGADFNLVNSPTKKGATFNAKFLEGIDQVIRRKQYSESNTLSYRDEVHNIRATVESGTQVYNSLPCKKGKLEVDRTKPVDVVGVVIGGRHNPSLQHVEDEKRAAWQKSLGFPIELMSWDSFLKRIR